MIRYEDTLLFVDFVSPLFTAKYPVTYIEDTIGGRGKHSPSVRFRRRETRKMVYSSWDVVYFVTGNKDLLKVGL